MFPRPRCGRVQVQWRTGLTPVAGQKSGSQVSCLEGEHGHGRKEAVRLWDRGRVHLQNVEPHLRLHGGVVIPFSQDPTVSQEGLGLRRLGNHPADLVVAA